MFKDFREKVRLLRALNRIYNHIKDSNAMEKWNSRKLIFSGLFQGLMAFLVAYLTGLDLPPEVVEKIVTLIMTVMGGQATFYVSGQTWIDRTRELTGVEPNSLRERLPGKPNASGSSE